MSEPTYTTNPTPARDGAGDLNGNLERLKSWLNQHKGNWVLVAPNGQYWIDKNLQGVVDSGHRHLSKRMPTKGGAT